MRLLSILFSSVLMLSTAHSIGFDGAEWDPDNQKKDTPSAPISAPASPDPVHIDERAPSCFESLGNLGPVEMGILGAGTLLSAKFAYDYIWITCETGDPFLAAPVTLYYNLLTLPVMTGNAIAGACHILFGWY